MKIKNKFSATFLYSFILIAWSLLSTIFFLKVFGIKLGQEQSKIFSSRITEFFVTVLFAPIIETLIFQTILYYIITESLSKYKTNIKNNSFIIISGVLFGLSHYFNVFLLGSAIIAGIILGVAFVDFKNKNNIFITSVLIVVVHSLFNFYVFLIKIIF